MLTPRNVSILLQNEGPRTLVDAMASNHTHYALPSPTQEGEQSRLGALYRCTVVHNGTVSQTLTWPEDVQHRIWLLTFDGNLTAPRLPDLAPSASVLDIGCGSGIWARAYATAHPEADVSAFDIAPPRLASSPTNLTVMHGDAEHDWPTHDTRFDLIHVRVLTLAIRDWRRFFARCWEGLKPGGWLEVEDTSTPYVAENPRTNCHSSMFIRLGFLFQHGVSLRGVDMAAPHYHVDRLRAQGFEDVQQDVYKWPANGEWPSDARSKEIGRLVSEDWESMACAGAPVILGGGLGMDAATVRDVLSGALDETRNDTSNGFHFAMWVLMMMLLACADHRLTETQVCHGRSKAGFCTARDLSSPLEAEIGVLLKSIEKKRSVTEKC